MLIIQLISIFLIYKATVKQDRKIKNSSSSYHFYDDEKYLNKRENKFNVGCFLL